jgi:radical SAM superfamily enzyme YgiQ (UPF0313 family)
MHMDWGIQYDEPVIRPPSEAYSLILQVTLGCTHNRCAFCVTYQNKRFRSRPREEILREIDWAGKHLPDVKRVFLGDGDAFALSTDRLLEILDRLKTRLPELARVSAYASPGNFRGKTVDELRQLRDAGLTFAYVGIESGDDEILRRIDKGYTQDQMVELLGKPKEAGIKLSATVILGLGGPRLSERHAWETARIIDRVQPRYASALTLMLAPRKPTYEEAFDDPAWRLLTPKEMVEELRGLVAHIEESGIIFRSNHASNYLALAGTFQRNKAEMLAQLDAALADPRLSRFRPEFMRGL